MLDVRKKEETSPAPDGPCVGSLAFTGRTVQVRIEGVLSPAVIDKKISDDLYIVKMIKSIVNMIDSIVNMIVDPTRMALMGPPSAP